MINGEGIKLLIDNIIKHLYSLSPKENSYLTSKRHVEGVKRAISAFERAVKLDINTNPELMSEELRSAAYSIGSITNVIDVEEILDDIFNSFCIGK